MISVKNADKKKLDFWTNSMDSILLENVHFLALFKISFFSS